MTSFSPLLESQNNLAIKLESFRRHSYAFCSDLVEKTDEICNNWLAAGVAKALENKGTVTILSENFQIGKTNRDTGKAICETRFFSVVGLSKQDVDTKIHYVRTHLVKEYKKNCFEQTTFFPDFYSECAKKTTYANGEHVSLTIEELIQDVLSYPKTFVQIGYQFTCTTYFKLPHDVLTVSALFEMTVEEIKEGCLTFTLDSKKGLSSSWRFLAYRKEKPFPFTRTTSCLDVKIAMAAEEAKEKAGPVLNLTDGLNPNAPRHASRRSSVYSSSSTGSNLSPNSRSELGTQVRNVAIRALSLFTSSH